MSIYCLYFMKNKRYIQVGNKENKVERLERHLGYHFNQKNYLQQALTHRSMGEKNNERLEFLGDSLLNYTMTDALFEQYPQCSEGQLSRLRAYLVKGETLAAIAIELNLGDYLLLGQGELKCGGFRRASILANTLEALFAAIYLDSNLATCKRIILSLYHTRLHDQHIISKTQDAKTQLQEYLQAKKLPLPIYELVQIEGEEHQQLFHTRCQVTSLRLQSIGKGSNRRKSEQDAAKEILRQLQN